MFKRLAYLALLFVALVALPHSDQAQSVQPVCYGGGGCASTPPIPLSTVVAGHTQLVAGTITVSNSAFLAVGGSRGYTYSVTTAGGTQGFLSIVVVPGVSITFNSTSITDTSKIDWEMY